MKKLLTILFSILVVTSFAQIQKNNQSALSIEQIMQDPAQWIGTSPSDIEWNDSGDKIYFEWNPDRDTLSSLYAYSLSTKKIEKVTPEEKQQLPGRFATVNNNRTKKVFVRDGNIILKDLKKGTEKQLTNWLERVGSPEFVMNDTKVAFTKDNNLYTVNLETGLIRQVTNFTSGNKKPESRSSEQDKWLEQQQKDLFVVLNERAAKSKARENQRKAEETEKPLEINTGKNRVSRISMSPSGNFVAYSIIDRGNSKSTSVTHFVTESGYTEERNARSKVGSEQGSSEMGIFDVQHNKKISINKSEIPGLKDLPDYLSD